MTEAHIHFKIDKELKKQLQIIALEKNETVTSLLTDLIQEYVNENK